ncbi:MAG: hypothetical protein JNK86_01585, partial [Alphaproteobacteria bacterium]|nr:hypothetical protein [Alphaproteobacteria bacterium]
ELVGAISAIANNPKAILSAEQSNRIAFHHQRLFNDFIATSPEILASEKILQSINNYIQLHGFPKISFTSLLMRKLKFFKHRRKMLKRHQGLTSRVNIQTRQNEFPALSLAQVQDKVLRLSSCLNHRFDRLIIRQLHDNIFSISNSVNGRIKNK